MAGRAKGVVVPISATDNTERAFTSVKAQVDELRTKVASLRSQLAAGGNPGQALAEGMEHAVPQVAAASGLLRELGGTIPIRAIERFVTSTLGLGSAVSALFPVVGAFAAIGAAAEGTKKLFDAIIAGQRAPELLRRDFQELQSKIHASNDELDLQNTKLQQQIDKLEGRHNNGLAAALADARVEADRLLTSLQADLKAMDAILKEREVGFFESAVSGQASTKKVDFGIQRDNLHLQDAQTVLNNQYAIDLKAAGNNANAKKAVEKKFYDDSDQLLADYIARRHKQAQDLRTQQQADHAPVGALADYVGGALEQFGVQGARQAIDKIPTTDYAAGIGAEEYAAQTAQLERDRLRSGQTNSALQVRLQGDKGAKADGNAARKAEEEERKRLEAQDRLDAARRQLADAGAREQAAAEKGAADAALAALDRSHKALLASEGEYYKQRAAIQNGVLGAQINALGGQGNDLAAQIAKLNGQKLTGNDATLRDAKVLELRAKQVEIEGQIAKLTGEQLANIDKQNEALDELARKRTADADRLAATLETGRGGSTAARSTQSRDEYQRRRQELQAEYKGDPRQAEVLGDLDQQQGIDQSKITAQGADETLRSGDAGRTVQRKGIDDAVKRGQLSTRDAQRERIALDREEADALQPVLAAQQALAAMGDIGAGEKVAELQQRIAALRNPVNEVAAEVRGQLDSAFERVFENIDRGRKALQDFGKALESDALKDVYKNLVQPGVQAGLGVLIPDRVGRNLPSGQGAAGSVLAGLQAKIFPGLKGGGAAASGSKGAPRVIVNVINQGDPLQKSSSSTSMSSDLEDLVTNIIVKKGSEGGPFAALFGLGGGD